MLKINYLERNIRCRDEYRRVIVLARAVVAYL